MENTREKTMENTREKYNGKRQGENTMDKHKGK